MSQINKSFFDLKRDKDFYQFNILNFYEAIYWINPEGYIIMANSTASQMLGYGKDELMDIPLSSITDSETVQDFPKFWQELKKLKKSIYKSRHFHKSGHSYEVEITFHYLIYNGNEIACALVRDISHQSMRRRTLNWPIPVWKGY